jgi:multidrug efflux pump subunit AcrB
MIVSDLSVKNRISVFVLVAVIILGGGYAYHTLPRESFPDVQIPNVIITTFYRGVSPEDMEQSVTMEIEQELKGLDGVKEIRSISSEGMSLINLEFTTDTDIDDALVKVKDKVDLAKPSLPTDLDEEPTVQEINTSDFPILRLSLSGTVGLRRLTTIAEEIQDEIEAVPGVLEAEIAGDVTRQVQVQVDPERMALYGMPFSLLESMVRAENANVSGGSIRTDESRFQLRIPGEFESPEEIDDIVVGTFRGGPVYLRDIARVVDGLEDRESYARTNGRDSVSIAVKKRSGENVLQIVDRVERILARLEPTWPPGTAVTTVENHAKDIRQMVADLENNIASGLLLVIAVVCLAMGLRNAVLVSLSIPLSMLISFMVLQALGVTLNMVVLFSLTLALGMLVDNAVVIIENIYRFMQQGVPRAEAAMRATGEVAWPIVGSSLTTIGAFFPLLFWGGIMGEFMSYIPQTVIITLASCLFVALVVNPALASVVMRAKTDGDAEKSAEEVMSGGEHPMLQGGSLFIRAYRSILRLALRMRLAVLLLAVGVLVSLGMLWYWQVGLEKGPEFFPDIDPQIVYINIDPPEGADLDYIDQVVREAAVRVFSPATGTADERHGAVERLSYDEAFALREAEKKRSGETYGSPSYLPDVEYIFEKASASAGTGMFEQGGASQVGVKFVDLEERQANTKETKRRIEARVLDIPGAEITVEVPQGGPPTGAPVNIEIIGPDFERLGEQSEEVLDLLKSGEVPHLTNIRSDYERGSPTLEIRVDRKRAALLGLSTRAVGNALRSAIAGTEVSTLRETNDDFDIVVRLLEADRHAVDTLRKLFIPTSEAGLVPLTTVADIVYTGGFGSIRRINHQRAVTVSADVDTAYTTGPETRVKVMALLEETFDPAQGYAYRFTGENQDQEESQAFLSWAMMVAVMLIFFVLVLQFNSLSYPLVIMSAVVLSLGGVFLGLTIYDMSWGIIMTSVGTISLAGVVVNNGIVLVDYTRQLMDRGLDREEAIVAAGATRLRPVLLTAATTMLGLVPMVTGKSIDFQPLYQLQWPRFQLESESSQWWGSMAVAVIFGLMVATMLTLVVVPVLISLVSGLRRSTPAIAAGIRRGFALPVWTWWRIYDAMAGTDVAGRWWRTAPMARPAPETEYDTKS